MKNASGKLLARLVVVLTIFAGAAFAQDKNVKIGVLDDMSGLYADLTGIGSVLALVTGVLGLIERRRLKGN